MADTRRWRPRSCQFGAVLFAILIQVVNGYEPLYTISQLSPKSVVEEPGSGDGPLQTSRTVNLAYSIEPSINVNFDDVEEVVPEDLVRDEETENHVIIARSVSPSDRESRSLNIDELPSSNNNEIDNELQIEQHNKRKYYEIHPTKTISYYERGGEEILKSSDGFGDKLDFKFPGEANRVPKARALPPLGPRIRPSAVQPPIFATATNREGRQNTEIQNIITGIVKLLNGNVNVQANSQLLNGRPGRPMNSRINNRGPPRISDVPPLPDFDKPMTPPPMVYHPTKTPPPYPFDRPPHHGVNLPEQIVPPSHSRPSFHRPLPPWQRPRPRPSNRRPNPNLPMYKPIPHIPDIPELFDDSKPEDEVTINENEASHLENNLHAEQEDKDIVTLINLPDMNVTEIDKDDKETTTIESTTTTSTTEKTTTTTSTTTTTTEKPTTTSTTTEKLTEKPTTSTEKTTTTTEKIKPEKPAKLEKDKKKETQISEKDKLNKDKYKIVTDDKIYNKTMKNDTIVDVVQSSMVEASVQASESLLPTPIDGLMSHSPVISGSSSANVIKTSSINSQPLPSLHPSQHPYNPYRPRPGLVLDDPDFKPGGSRYRPQASVITAPERPPGYGEIFDVTVSAIQGPGDSPNSVHIETVNLNRDDHDDIIVSASGDQGFVSIDGKRTYLNLHDEPTVHMAPTRVQQPQQSVAPPSRPVSPPASGLGSAIGTGVAVPADDVLLQQPQRRPQTRPQHGYRRPQPTVRIDTCIVGDDSTCDQTQNEKCRTEAGISSCQCRPGFARRIHSAPCRRVVSFVLNVRVDKVHNTEVAWNPKLADKESEPFQQLSYEAVRAIDSAFSMTPFSDDFVSGTVNSIHRGDSDNPGVFVNYTVLLTESPDKLHTAVGAEIQKHIGGVIRRRQNNIGQSALWVETPAGSVLPLTDLDECASPELNDCNKQATCTNTWGGFRCTCPETTLDTFAADVTLSGRQCKTCASSHCSERGVCKYRDSKPYCSCNSGYYGSTCEVDGEVVGVGVGASLAAALVIALTLAALLSWSRKWSREQKAVGMGSPVFSYMAGSTIKAPPYGGSVEERLRWAQIAEAMAHAGYHPPEPQAMATRPSSAMFGGYPTLPPVPMPRLGLHNAHHTGTLNTVASRANTSASHHNLYGYTNQLCESSGSDSSRAHDALVPRPKSRATLHNQSGIYYDVEYENAPESIYGTKGIPLSTYTVSRGPPFYRT